MIPMWTEAPGVAKYLAEHPEAAAAPLPRAPGQRCGCADCGKPIDVAQIKASPAAQDELLREGVRA